MNPAPGTAVYVDIENLAGRWWEVPAESLTTWAIDIWRLIPDSAAVFVVGAPDLLAAILTTVRPNWCVRTARRRPDDADRRLIRLMEWPPVCSETVVVMSGDHAFAAPVSRLRAVGQRVVVIAPMEGCSRLLAQAADELLLIPTPAPGQSLLHAA